MGVIAIIGAGNVGQAIAGHMTLTGHDVRLYSPWSSEFDPIRAEGGIHLTGDVEGIALPQMLTDSLEDAVADASVVVVAVPAFAHRAVSEQLAQIVTPDQVVLFQPSALGSGLELANAFAAADRPASLIAETGTSLYTCRLQQPAHVHVARIKPSVSLGATPFDRAGDVLERLAPFFGERFRADDDALTVGMSRIGSVYHVPPALFNFKTVEEAERLPHNTLATPRIAAVIDAIDAERLALGSALGVRPVTFREFLARSYGVTSGTLPERIRDSYGPLNFPEPDSPKHRYFTEDIPFNIFVWKSLAEQIGLPMPLTDGILAISAILCDEDWSSSGRSAEDLGLQGASAHEIREAFRTGASSHARLRLTPAR